MRDDLHVHVYHVHAYNSADEGASHSLRNKRGMRQRHRAQTLFAYFNLASFCAHFGRMDEAIALLRVAINNMTAATEGWPRRWTKGRASQPVPSLPPTLHAPKVQS